jgi:uncharacterized protein YndB with AHSA1/START domain
MLALLVLGAWNFHATVRTERTFNASAPDVWRVWNDANSIKKWWGPKGYTALVVRNDVRQGGSYLWAMKSEQGRMFWSTGTYKEVVANKRIVSTMSFSNENGRIIPGSQVSVPGKWPDEIAVIVEFSESQGKTRVTVAEVGIPLIVYPLSKIGWAQQFDKIQSLLRIKATGLSQLPVSRQLGNQRLVGVTSPLHSESALRFKA